MLCAALSLALGVGQNTHTHTHTMKHTGAHAGRALVLKGLCEPPRDRRRAREHGEQPGLKRVRHRQHPAVHGRWGCFCKRGLAPSGHRSCVWLRAAACAGSVVSGRARPFGDVARPHANGEKSVGHGRTARAVSHGCHSSDVPSDGCAHVPGKTWFGFDLAWCFCVVYVCVGGDWPRAPPQQCHSRRACPCTKLAMHLL